MQWPTAESPWYIDVRNISSAEKISLDLARHLPLRTSVGSVVVVTSRPAVMLPVIKKRWIKVIREVERQYSSTLNRFKKEGLQQELMRLRLVAFAANSAYIYPRADVIFTAAEHMGKLGEYRTLYLLDPLPSEQLALLHKHLPPESLIVSYCGPFEPSISST